MFPASDDVGDNNFWYGLSILPRNAIREVITATISGHGFTFEGLSCKLVQGN